MKRKRQKKRVRIGWRVAEDYNNFVASDERLNNLLLINVLVKFAVERFSRIIRGKLVTRRWLNQVRHLSIYGSSFREMKLEKDAVSENDLGSRKLGILFIPYTVQFIPSKFLLFLIRSARFPNTFRKKENFVILKKDVNM